MTCLMGYLIPYGEVGSEQEVHCIPKLGNTPALSEGTQVLSGHRLAAVRATGNKRYFYKNHCLM